MKEKEDNRWVIKLIIYLILLLVLIIPPLVFGKTPKPKSPAVKTILIKESLKKSAAYRDSLLNDINTKRLQIIWNKKNLEPKMVVETPL